MALYYDKARLHWDYTRALSAPAQRH